MRRSIEMYLRNAVFCMLLVGCSSDHGQMHVSGKVTVGGEPAASGTILFTPKDGHSQVVGGVIENGSYQIETPPGEKIVQIRAVRLDLQEFHDQVTGKTFQAENPVRLTDTKYELPRSPLRATITKSGEQFDFDLPKLKQKR